MNDEGQPFVRDDNEARHRNRHVIECCAPKVGQNYSPGQEAARRNVQALKRVVVMDAQHDIVIDMYSKFPPNVKCYFISQSRKKIVLVCSHQYFIDPMSCK